MRAMTTVHFVRGEVGLVRLVDSVALPGPSYISGGYVEAAFNVMSVFHQESKRLCCHSRAMSE